jgi:hypothetical protein
MTKEQKQELMNFAVYWNNEYIGEATAFSIKRGRGNIIMPILDIKGKLQVVKQ